MLKFSNIAVSYGSTKILHDVCHVVPHGHIHALTGASGAGKTTLLRALAGLIPDAAGTVMVDGVDVSSMPAHRRGIGLAFQDPHLFDTMNVAGNIGYGLRMHGMPSEQRVDRIHEMLEMIELPGFADREIGSLSGGQARRVALARHLAPRPSVLLLDEPFAALDSDTQTRLVSRVRDYTKRHDITVLASTHMHFDATSFADAIVALSDIDRRG